MKRLIAAIASIPFAAAVSAAEIYQGIDLGNSDLDGDRAESWEVVGVRPGVGDSFDRYHGWADGNSDLFRKGRPDGLTTNDPDVYMSFGRNPDLAF